MKANSILNDVLGPVMHGPSSSHTAASWRIGHLAKGIIGDEIISRAAFTLDPAGSYSQVYHQQGSDLSFLSGLLGWEITDPRYFEAFEHCRLAGIEVEFKLATIKQDKHPNAVIIDIVQVGGRATQIIARSTGGGGIEITEIDGCKLLLNGTSESHIYWADSKVAEAADLAEIESIKNVERVATLAPIYHLKKGQAIFASGKEVAVLAQKSGKTLGQLAIAYEAELLGLPESKIIEELDYRLRIMRDSVAEGLAITKETSRMRTLSSSAASIMEYEKTKKPSPMTRCAARAMAAMHSCASGGIVCAAPTGGSAGVLPAVMMSLEEEGIEVINSLAAAGLVGLIFLNRGTFAAEVAGCQVEIGAAGAMASAAVVEANNGTAEQAMQAAAIALQNSMGMVCDLVDGTVEIPCHTRNAVAAANGFINADMIMGGYANPITLDDSVDASIEVGTSLKPEHRCTSRGGIAITESARKLINS
jgi:L-serine dehydratase